MKKIIITSTIILIAILLAIFFACNKENKEQTADRTVQNFIKLTHEGAIVHNEGLSYIYAKLTEIKFEKDILTVVEDLTLDFIKSNAFFKSDIDGAITAAKNVSTRVNNTKSISSVLWFEEDEDLLSDSQKRWLTLVNDVIEQNDDVKQMLQALDKIETLVLKEGSDEDQYIVIIAVEIAKETMDYWYNNYSDWEKLLSDNPSKGNWSWSWKECGKADISGCIGGAIGGGMAGGIPGAGAGALGGAVGGAVAGSAVYAVDRLLDWIW